MRRFLVLTVAVVLVLVACSTSFDHEPLFGFWCAPGEYHSCACPWEDAASTHRWGETHCTASMHLGPCQCDGGPDADPDAK